MSPRPLILIAVLLLAGCASRQQAAEQLARGRDLVPAVVDGGPFSLFTYAPRRLDPAQPLEIYIEGDGYAWIDRYRLSDDPTPREPEGLALAVRDPAPNLIYIARPCQYVAGPDRRNCSPAYWSAARFSEEVVAATSRAIDQFLSRSGSRQVRLIGYSGGGAIAALVAERRADVVELVTVAGILDSAAWTELRGTDPLYASLNPADGAGRLAGVPQRHFVGQMDDVAPIELAHSFLDRFPENRRPAVISVPGQTHCCWAGRWPALLTGASE